MFSFLKLLPVELLRSTSSTRGASQYFDMSLLPASTGWWMVHTVNNSSWHCPCQTALLIVHTLNSPSFHLRGGEAYPRHSRSGLGLRVKHVPTILSKLDHGLNSQPSPFVLVATDDVSFFGQVYVALRPRLSSKATSLTASSM